MLHRAIPRPGDVGAGFDIIVISSNASIVPDKKKSKNILINHVDDRKSSNPKSSTGSRRIVLLETSVDTIWKEQKPRELTFNLSSDYNNHQDMLYDYIVVNILSHNCS